MRTYDLQAPISKYFCYKHALFLPSWDRYAEEKDGLTDQVLDRLTHLFLKLDLVQDFLGAPLIIHVAYRPQAYNQKIGGAKDSAHMALRDLEAAADFHPQKMGILAAQKRIYQEKKLEEWGMRMENLGNQPNWIHLDTRIPLPGGKRFFKP